MEWKVLIEGNDTWKFTEQVWKGKIQNSLFSPNKYSYVSFQDFFKFTILSCRWRKVIGSLNWFANALSAVAWSRSRNWMIPSVELVVSVPLESKESPGAGHLLLSDLFDRLYVCWSRGIYSPFYCYSCGPFCYDYYVVFLALNSLHQFRDSLIWQLVFGKNFLYAHVLYVQYQCHYKVYLFVCSLSVYILFFRLFPPTYAITPSIWRPFGNGL